MKREGGRIEEIVKREGGRGENGGEEKEKGN